MAHSKKNKFNKFYMDVCMHVSKLSYCNRKKVGCIIVKKNNIISYGYNGTVAGTCNDCEDQKNVTLKHVIHAELNAIIKASKIGSNIKNSTMYLTLSPCIECSKLIVQSGIKKVIYLEEYNDNSGILFLKKYIKIKQIDPNKTVRRNLHCG